MECASPLCGDVGAAHEVFTEGYHQFWFEDAEVESIDEIPSAFFKHLAAARESFSMDRMGLCIRRFRRQHLSSLEKHPTDTLTEHMMRYFLYYPTEAEHAAAGLAECCDPLTLLPALEAMSCADWQAFLSFWYFDRPCAVIVGRPSASLVKENAENEAARVEKQKERLGPSKLAEFGQALEAAVAANGKEIPEECLTCVPIPSKGEVRAVPCPCLAMVLLTPLPPPPRRRAVTSPLRPIIGRCVPSRSSPFVVAARRRLRLWPAPARVSTQA